MTYETTFTMDTSAIKYGAGVTREVGADLSALGCKRVMLVTDGNLKEGVAVQTAVESCRAEGLEFEVFDRVRVEPTDASFGLAIDRAVEGKFDGFLAVGGGSVIDTAKAANLYSTYPAELLTYVNLPVGQGKPVPGRLKPLVAVPTTAGTGSETTGVAIFDYVAMHAKTGIAHRALRPSLGVLDPLNTVSMPAMVTACSALDVLSHAIESYTAMSYTERPAPEYPRMRPAYQGANPISDIWSTKAMELVAATLENVISNPDDIEARGTMMLAAAYAGIGFGNAGVHLPHGMSYPVSGKVRSFRPEGYPDDLVRAGIKLLVTACNTACAVALEHLRTRFDLEIVGLEPAVKPAVLLTRSGRIAVFATPRTIASPRLAGLIDRHGRGVEIELLAAPGWVELVEDGISDPERASSLIEPLVEPVVDRGADVLVLGCMHYPFLEPLIRAAAGAQAEIVDSGAAIARRACELLDRHELSMPASGSTGTVSLMTTSPDARSVGILATRLLGTTVAASSVIV